MTAALGHQDLLAALLAVTALAWLVRRRWRRRRMICDDCPGCAPGAARADCPLRPSGAGPPSGSGPYLTIQRGASGSAGD
jgi:hypothetical protein